MPGCQATGMFHGQSFATMILVQNGSAITGSVTESKIAQDEDGELARLSFPIEVDERFCALTNSWAKSGNKGSYDQGMYEVSQT
jgi:hypothetical protein